MGLDMKTRKKICGEIYRRYQKAKKKGKAKILDEYAITLKYNRDYLAHLLTNWEKKRYALLGGKKVKFIAKPPVKGRHSVSGGTKTGRPEKYHKAFVKVLAAIWGFFDCPCGKLLVPLLRGILDFLVGEFKLDEAMRAIAQNLNNV